MPFRKERRWCCLQKNREGREEMKMAECDVDLCEVREVHQEKVSEITAKKDLPQR